MTRDTIEPDAIARSLAMLDQRKTIQPEMPQMDQQIRQTTIAQAIDPNDPMALLGGTEAGEAAKRKRQEMAQGETPDQQEPEQIRARTRRGKRSRKRKKAA